MGGQGSGVHLPVSMRRLIQHYASTADKSAEEIYELLLVGLPPNFTFARMQTLCTKFRALAGSDWEHKYLSGNHTRKANAGRHFCLSEADKQELGRLVRNRCTRRLSELRDELYLILENEIANIPSTSTIFNTLSRMGYTLKVIN